MASVVKQTRRLGGGGFGRGLGRGRLVAGCDVMGGSHAALNQEDGALKALTVDCGACVCLRAF